MKVVFISRKPSEQQSIERVFEQVGRDLEGLGVATEVQTLPYGSDPLGVLLNLLFFKPVPGDVYHVTGHVHFISLVLPPNKTVLTIHDLGFLGRREGFRGWLIRKLFLDWPCRRTRWVTVISEATQQHLLREAAVPPENLLVIDNPIRDEFCGNTKRPKSDCGKTVLHVGTAPHKNLETLIEAVAGTDMRLHIVGQLSENQRSALARSGVPFVNSAVLDADGILNAYLEADVLCFCSTFEGFGLPIIEANALGLPVVTSNLSPLRDIGGDGVLTVEPLDPDALRDALTSVMNDESVREALIQGGFSNVERFGGRRAAELYRNVYLRITEGDIDGRI